MQNSCTVTDYGAVGDNKTLNTRAIQKCIASCHDRYPNHSIVVIFPEGVFLTGSFNLTSNTTLYLEEHAVLSGSMNPHHYPLCKALPELHLLDNDNAKADKRLQYCALVSAYNKENIGIAGQGVIDGQGWPWWRNYSQGKLKHQRPKLVEFVQCKKIRMTGFFL